MTVSQTVEYAFEQDFALNTLPKARVTAKCAWLHFELFAVSVFVYKAQPISPARPCCAALRLLADIGQNAAVNIENMAVDKVGCL